MTLVAGFPDLVPAPDGVSYSASPSADQPGRWAALDVARGVAVAGMLLVEQLPTGPRRHPWLIHATWNGWTGADLVFPAFLFLVGISTDELLRRRGKRALARLARRALVLVVVGILFNAWAASGANFAYARWPGVLQRIGLVSVACGIVIAITGRRIWPTLLAAGVILVVYAQLLTHARLTCGTGILTPTCNPPGHIDIALFGARHIYDRGTFGYDPEGLLSTLGALATALIGVAVGRLLRLRPGWPTMAILCAVALLSWTATNHGLAGIAVNKRLWTPAFVIVTAATATLLLLACHLVADVWAGHPNPAARFGARVLAWPWAALGRNALVVYVGQHVLGAILQQTPAHDETLVTTKSGYLQEHFFAGGLLGLDSQWTYVGAVLLLWSAVASAMHCARWYVTL